MYINKREAYSTLVKSRKVCQLCNGLTNPSECDNGIFDTDQIGLWSVWQGNLDAKLMVIGQDWGDNGPFVAMDKLPKTAA